MGFVFQVPGLGFGCGSSHSPAVPAGVGWHGAAETKDKVGQLTLFSCRASRASCGFPADGPLCLASPAGGCKCKAWGVLLPTPGSSWWDT